MSTNTVRCQACRGQKEAPGLGGIVKKCRACDGAGQVEIAVVTSAPSNAVVTTISTDEAVKTVGRKRKPKNKEPETVDMFPVIAPGIDEFTQAILDEPRLDPLTWKAKYKHIPRLFGINPMTQMFDELISKVERANIRATYASAQPKIARKVDMTKSQDVGADARGI